MPTRSPLPFASTGTPITGTPAEICHRFRYYGAEPPPINFARVVNATWGSVPFDQYELELRQDGSALVGRLVPKTRPAGDALLHGVRNWNESHAPFHARLADETEVSAEFCTLRRASPAEGTLVLDNWTWRSATRPQHWIGILNGVGRIRRGNLVLIERDEGSGTRRSCSTNLALSGKYRWYVIERADRGEPAAVVLGALQVDVARDELASDLMAMEFAVGRPLRLEYLVGVDSELVPIGAIGLDHGFRRISESIGEWPVPDEWMPDFFQAVAGVVTDHTETLVEVPVTAFLDSLVDHLDGAYLKVQIALEAFCSALRRDEEKVALVVDAKQWRQWVNDHAQEIRQHGLNEQAGEVLIGKVHSAMNAPTGNVVREVFES